VPSLKRQLADAADQNPALKPYLGRLIASCCRRVPDTLMRARVKVIADEHPEFRADLLPFTKPDLPVRRRARR